MWWRRANIIAAIGAAIAICLTLAADGQVPPSRYTGPKVTMTTKFKPGQYALVEKLNLKMTMNVNGMKLPIDMGMTIGGDVDISAADPKTRDQDVSCTITWMRMNMGVMGQAMEYDSKVPAGRQNAELAEALEPLIGYKATMIARDGKFINAKDAVAGMMAAMQRAGAPGQLRTQMEKQMAQFFDDMLTKHWGELLTKDPVGPGDKWTATMKCSEVPIFGNLGVKADCSVEDIVQTSAGKLVAVRFVADMEVEDKVIDPKDIGEGQLPAGAAIKLNRLTSKASGKFRFNTDVGVSTDMTMNMDMDGRFTATIADQTQVMDMTCKVIYENTLTSRGPTSRPD